MRRLQPAEIRPTTTSSDVMKSEYCTASRRRDISVFGVIAIAVCSGFLSSCVYPESARPSAAPSETGRFSGPYAAELYSAWKSAPEGFVRDALADGAISEQEYNESWSRYSTCLAEAGITVQSREFDGSYTTESVSALTGEEQEELISACSTRAGEAEIIAPFNWIRRNPQNLDENTIIAECLVRSGLAPRGYDGTDYDRDSSEAETREPPFITSEAERKAYTDCTIDPLGLDRG